MQGMTKKQLEVKADKIEGFREKIQIICSTAKTTEYFLRFQLIYKNAKAFLNIAFRSFR